MSRRRLLAVALLAASLAFAACSDADGGSGDGGAPAGPAADATVNLKPTTFEPDKTTIKVGETVAWKWGGGVQHDVQGEDFKSKVQQEGTFSHTFNDAGTFAYHCNVHPTTMKGTITVGS
jgi:plastocyanin